MECRPGGADRGVAGADLDGAIYFDSSALTAGTVQAADKELRGATMGLHSMCGYAGEFIGPLGRAGARLDGQREGLGLGVRPSRPDHRDGARLAPRRCKTTMQT